jgi:DNA-binding CsgD family transcriptional regulator
MTATTRTRRAFHPKAGAPLSEREIQVLRRISQGHSNARIGRNLSVSEDTVKTHVRHILVKLCARDRAHAVFLGVRAGVVPVRPAQRPTPVPPAPGRIPPHMWRPITDQHKAHCPALHGEKSCACTAERA